MNKNAHHLDLHTTQQTTINFKTFSILQDHDDQNDPFQLYEAERNRRVKNS